jgi:hypothetical protein
MDAIAARLFPLTDDWLSTISYMERAPNGYLTTIFFG